MFITACRIFIACLVLRQMDLRETFMKFVDSKYVLTLLCRMLAVGCCQTLTGICCCHVEGVLQGKLEPEQKEKDLR